jgi:hypothetical protein
VVALQAIFELLNRRKNEALLLAESSLPESQYRAFRKLFLNIFGKDGLEAELARLYAEDGRRGRDRNGRE